MVYIMDERRRLGEPSGAYYGVLERAYKKFGFPMEILQTALKAGRAGETLPDGWEAGDTCYMVTNKRKGYTSAYTVQGYDGKYFRLLNSAGNLYRASAWRMFRSHEAAVSSLQGNGGVGNEA